MAFEEFPQFEPQPEEVATKGLTACYEVLRQEDAISKAFNALDRSTQELLIAIAGIQKCDLRNPDSSGMRLQHYNKAGFLKIARAMWKVRSISDKLPCNGSLVAYTKAKYLDERERKHHAVN